MYQERDEALVIHLKKQGVDDKMVIGHPAGLFVLFFTEMWERFSYYGMRALLTLFLISSLADKGWGWSNEEAMKLYGLYTGLVYLTPLIGGMIADKLTGFKKAILIGALIMTMGHLSMAFEGINANFFYVGLGLMILGNGMFKPNISSMVGNLYPDASSKKDAGYTIFYMGINAGSFLGMLLCGYIGEKVGWHYGFGLAGVFMFFGMLQFYFAQKIFGVIGESPKATKAFHDEKIKNHEEEPEEVIPANVVRDRLIVIAVLMIASIVFFLAFEQAGGSMSIFAKDYTQRVLSGNTATTFKWIDTILTIAPMVIVSIVLLTLAKKIYKQYPLTIIFTGVSFIVIWCLGLWKVFREFGATETEVAASWFQILNAFFIISLANSFSKFWEKIWNPSGPVKFALGLLLVGVGFAALAYGASEIPQGAKTATVSMVWLIIAYFFHSTGELCLSPVGLSYVSKLSPKKLLGLLFGFWFCASAIANFIGGYLGSYIDKITAEHSMSYFFMIFAIVPAATALLLLILNPVLKKMMHGIN
ncbi:MULTISPECIES: peptide MFS transporter [Sphingobacterium]|jgi:POT family proton-dependent oligopeptide transporter|uniref:peptide MFS transporter n=1 Tax=Sphingobacterium TaxID=28453 RepID=UPI0004E5F4F8|nr:MULTISPECIES: peptide MFS transporter [Sphingobacterium]CDS92761.1 POT family proton (H+)-dependent oligopeptide transporter [Sphingobacterium sp. PM2-P1-29]SJN48783.1 Di-/tripeptide transporter [Sphingobacterium faecium PCAi_F2.5]UPZ36624.1 peptide MFS transporter [Sphingobacterium sp. PCS056]UXD68141.1 peptide MFS transporter [Sphingobacterium faecium]WGQ15852.1 peptide MFS transporter [Sphingobacterium faecium]